MSAAAHQGNGEGFAGIDKADILEARLHVEAFNWWHRVGVRRDHKGYCTHDGAEVPVLLLLALRSGVINTVISQ